MSASGTLEAVDRIINRGGDADDVLRSVVRVLHERAGFVWAGVAFVEEDGLVLGPQVGELSAAPAAFPVSFRGEKVAELRVAPAPDDVERQALARRVALVISPYCLVGWDTSGVPWDEVR